MTKRSQNWQPLSPSALLGAVHGGDAEITHFWRQRVDTEERVRCTQLAATPPASPSAGGAGARLARGFAHAFNNNSFSMSSSLRMGFEGPSSDRNSTQTGSSLAETYRAPNIFVQPEEVATRSRHELLCPALGGAKEVPRVRRMRMVPGCPKNQLPVQGTEHATGASAVALGSPVGSPLSPRFACLPAESGHGGSDRKKSSGSRSGAGGNGLPSSRASVAAAAAPLAAGEPSTVSSAVPPSPRLQSSGGAPVLACRHNAGKALSNCASSSGSTRLPSVPEPGSAAVSPPSAAGASCAAPRESVQEPLAGESRGGSMVSKMEGKFFPRNERFVERLYK